MNFSDPFGLCPPCDNWTPAEEEWELQMAQYGAQHPKGALTLIGVALGGAAAGIALASEGTAAVLGAAETVVTRAERDAAAAVARQNAPKLAEFFRTGKLPEGMTREVLENYRTVARWAVQNAEKLDKSGEQARRLKMIADALRKLK